jgi:hypothetical protein
MESNSDLMMMKSSEIKQKEKICIASNQDMRPTAEIELLKNDLEREKMKNEELKEIIEEKALAIQNLQAQLTEKKAELSEMKKKEFDVISEFSLEKVRYDAKIECFQKENQELLEKLDEYKFVEQQVEVVRREIEEKYQKKIMRIKGAFKERFEKYKKREIKFISEQSRLSSELEGLLKKFEILEEKLPNLKEIIKQSCIKDKKIEENLLKNVKNEIIGKAVLEQKTIKHITKAKGKENIEIPVLA